MAYSKGASTDIGIGTGKGGSAHPLAAASSILSSVVDVSASVIGGAVNVYVKSAAATINTQTNIYILAGTDSSGSDNEQFDDIANALASYQFTHAATSTVQHWTCPLPNLDGIKYLKVKAVSFATGAGVTEVWARITLATV